MTEEKQHVLRLRLPSGNAKFKHDRRCDRWLIVMVHQELDRVFVTEAAPCWCAQSSHPIQPFVRNPNFSGSYPDKVAQRVARFVSEIAARPVPVEKQV